MYSSIHRQLIDPNAWFRRQEILLDPSLLL
jgi:hypothetical protein